MNSSSNTLYESAKALVPIPTEFDEANCHFNDGSTRSGGRLGMVLGMKISIIVEQCIR